MATKTPRRGNRHVRQWTRERVLEAVRAWEEKFGRPPREADWNPARTKLLVAGSMARVKHAQEVLAEYATGKYPSSRTLQDLYDGKWAEGIKDAGFVPLPSGRPDKSALSQYVRRSDDVDEAALEMCIDDARTALKEGTRMEKRQALLDLASMAATLAEEIK